MSIVINSGPEPSPKKKKRLAGHRAEVSPRLRKAVTEAAHEIRNAHREELADKRKANRAGELFTSLLRRNDPAGPTSEGVDLLAAEIGGLVGDAIRGGAGLFQGSLQFLTEEWLAALSAGRKSDDERLPAENATHEDSLPSATSELPVPPPGPEEVRIQAFLRQFMPMLASAVRQGRNGHGLAETVIRLFGRQTYDEASGLGAERIMQLIQGEPALWAQVAPIEGEFRRFLEEFADYDASSSISSG